MKPYRILAGIVLLHAMSSEAAPTQLANSIADFGFRFFSELRNDNPTGNLVFSPLSISTAFSAVFLGAGGNTRQQLDDVFGYQGGTVANDLFLKKSLEFSKSNGVATLANRAFIQKNLRVTDLFSSPDLVEVVDFAGEPESARSVINKFVDETTNGFISDLMPPGSITSSNVFVLANAIYFKGEWEKEFKKANTFEGEFSGGSGIRNVDYMLHTRGLFNYKKIPKLDVEAIELPYKGGGFAMALLLPNKENGWKQLEKNIQGSLDSIIDGYTPTNFQRVQIPKFSIETTVESLEKTLPRIGLVDPFDPNRADLTGIVQDVPLFVDRAVHKAKIRVDEKGTVAGAATGISFTPLSLVTGEEFVADRPFMYFIVDKSDGSILFMGSVVDP